jgi:proline iminopeptidase
MSRRQVRAGVDGGDLVGWVHGSGPRVLLLHGGPGLSYDYLDGLGIELGSGFEVAAYQQRGLAPSTATSPFDVATQVADVSAVLDSLGWETAYLVGHSWGGHLSFHFAVSVPARTAGVLAIDPLGAVGDGGFGAFGEAFRLRTPPDIWARAQELDERAERGEGTAEDMVEGLRLIWPAYFPAWDTAPPMPPIAASPQAYSETFASLLPLMPTLAARLPELRLRLGLVAGGESPMPVSASTDISDIVPGAWTEVVPGAGHFPWIDRPGSVRAALDRLAAG